MKNSAQLSCGSALCNHQDESLQCWNSSFLFISVFLLPSGDLGLLQPQRPLPSETFGFQLPSVALGKAKHSGGFILSCWSSFLKILQSHQFCGQTFGPMTGLALGRNCNTPFSLCCAWQGWISKPVQGCGLLHPSEAVGSERTCQNPCWWANGSIYCVSQTWILRQLENPSENSQAVLLLWPALEKEQLSCSVLLIFFVWPVPISAKLQSQRRFLLLRIMDVLTLKNHVALAGVKLLAGLPYCSLQLEEIMLNVASSPGKTHQGTFGAVPALH